MTKTSWLKGNKQGSAVNAQLDLSAIKTFARIRIKDMKEPCIVLKWTATNKVEYITEKSRDISVIDVAHIECILDADILAVTAADILALTVGKK